MAMSLRDYEGRIVLGAGSFIIAWLTFLTVAHLEVPTRQDVQDSIASAIRNSPYVIDQPLITNKFDQLFQADGRALAQNERILEQLQTIKIELERLNVKQQMQIDELKKGTK